MLGSVYEQITPVTTADLAATKDTDMFDIQSTANAIRTLTLWKSRERDRFFIVNNSIYLGVAALHADDSAFVGSKLILPGQTAEFASDDVGNWRRVNGTPAAQVVRSLTAANIIAMGTTPVALLQAPGAGRVIVVKGIGFQMTRTATAFTGGGALEFRYTDASGVKVSADIAESVVDTGGAGVEYVHVAGIEASIIPVANAAIVIRNPTAAFADGTGTAKAAIDFVVHDYN